MRRFFKPPVLMLAAAFAGLGLAPAATAEEVLVQEAAPPIAKTVPAGGEPAPAETKLFVPRLVGAQFTYIRQHLYRFGAPYSGANSLTGEGDTQATATYGAYFGMALTRRLQAYVDIELFKGAGVGRTVGIGGLTDGDILRQGNTFLHKLPYVARRYLLYTLPLGEEREALSRAQDQLPGTRPAKRVELKLGTFAVIDDFDRNRYANSTRTQFQNWDLWNNMAWDYVADTRGYSNGAYVGYLSPTWALRASVMQMPSQANGQDLDAPLSKARGEQMELTLQPGKSGTVVRAGFYENIARMGDYREALAIAAARGTVPDIAADDQDGRRRAGWWLNAEQPLADDGDTGVFARAGWNDGKVESFANTEVDQTASVGIQVSGVHWKRTEDRLGAGIAVNGLSRPHRDYLAAGGSGFVLGDGRLGYSTEQIAEVYYRIQMGKFLQISPDFQYIRNPGYNHDRGPARIAGIRIHAEF